MPKCSITIEFDREFDREYFTGQMSDGFGENFCNFRQTSDDQYHCDFLGESDFYLHAIEMALKYDFDRLHTLAPEAMEAWKADEEARR